MFKKISEGVYSIVSRSNGLALDFYKGKYENGTNVQVYEQHSGEDQQWKLKRVLKQGMVNFNIKDVYRSNYTQQANNITVSVDGNALTKDKDYKVSYMFYGDSVSYIVTGLGDYCDSVTKTYSLLNEPESKTTSKIEQTTSERETTSKVEQTTKERETTSKICHLRAKTLQGL